MNRISDPVTPASDGPAAGGLARCVTLIVATVALFLFVQPVSAQGGPTATPTSPPGPAPTATDPFRGLRPTPTMWNTVVPRATFDNSQAEQLADYIVQSWHSLNIGRSETSAGLLDWIVFISMLGFIFRAVARLVRRRNIEQKRPKRGRGKQSQGDVNE